MKGGLRIYRAVEFRSRIKGSSGGLWDVLSCGHAVHYDGEPRTTRLCVECVEAWERDHPTLDADLLLPEIEPDDLASG